VLRLDPRRRPPDGSSLFEIGSITKTFTGGLLADMHLRGAFSLDDPLFEVTFPHRGRHGSIASPRYLSSPLTGAGYPTRHARSVEASSGLGA
jgi:hypothetical protein